MIKQPHSLSREILVAAAVGDVVAELRLVDPADYAAFIRLEHFTTLSDLVESAAELYFMPGTVRLGHGAEVHMGWTETPRVVLDLELRPTGATVYFSLSLEAETASVEVHYVAFDTPDPDPAANTAFLESAMEHARLRRTEPAVQG